VSFLPLEAGAEVVVDVGAEVVSEAAASVVEDVGVEAISQELGDVAKDAAGIRVLPISFEK
jgi:hypothetical protein